MTAKIELFGLPNPHYTHFWAPLGRNGWPKRGVKKSCSFEEKPGAFLGGSAAEGGALELKNSSKFAEEACFEMKDCRKGMH